jgi:hypothetical protein
MNSHYEESIKKRIEEDSKLISVFLQNVKDGYIILSDAERLYLNAKIHFKLVDTKYEYLRGSLYKKSILWEKSRKHIENELKDLAVSLNLYRVIGVRTNEIKSIYRLLR